MNLQLVDKWVKAIEFSVQGRSSSKPSNLVKLRSRRNVDFSLFALQSLWLQHMQTDPLSQCPNHAVLADLKVCFCASTTHSPPVQLLMKTKRGLQSVTEFMFRIVQQATVLRGEPERDDRERREASRFTPRSAQPSSVVAILTSATWRERVQ